MKKYFLLFAFSVLGAAAPAPDFSDQQKIAVQNSILAQINGETISVMDVKKKMDLIFHRHYPHLENSPQARCQFYEAQWRPTVMELINHQLILADAVKKEIPLSDGEVREEIEERFGPNIMFTLDKLDLSYDETWKIVKDEMIVQRMSWWYIQSKAMNQITPQDIRQAFRTHLKENPASQELRYRVIAIRGKTPEESSQKVHQFLVEKNTSPEALLKEMQKIDPSATLSSEFCAKDFLISDAHRAPLATLSPGEYSVPTLQTSRASQETVARIFYLYEATDHPAPQFEIVANNLKNELFQKAADGESKIYLEKLRKDHVFDENIPKDLKPFSIQ